jgi:hypothetical protein
MAVVGDGGDGWREWECDGEKCSFIFLEKIIL